MAFLVSRTCLAHRTAPNSTQTSFCIYSLRLAVCNTAHTLWFLDRLRVEYIGTTRDRTPDKSSQCIRPCSRRIPYCILSCLVCCVMADKMAVDRRSSLDHDIRCRRDNDRRTSVYTRLYSTGLAMDCNWHVVVVCMACDLRVDALTSGNSICLCSLLPSHNHILHLVRQLHFRRWQFVVLQIRIESIFCLRIFRHLHLPVKHPLLLRAFAFRTGSIALSEQGENLLLFFLSPDVALANIMKFPSSPPGVHCSGSC